MKRELKRIFYVTPTNFIELLKGYEKILKQKQTEIGAQVIKLDTGLEKLDQASKSVNIMTAESNIKSAEVNTIDSYNFAKFYVTASIFFDINQQSNQNPNKLSILL
jgi:hypothetical protein